jgi:hypothetical protein
MSTNETNQYVIILEKILEHIKDDKLHSKNDLKLYGINGESLQKEVMWDIFEKYVVHENNKKEKSKIIRKFHRGNLL